jgi:hypothetical protein
MQRRINDYPARLIDFNMMQRSFAISVLKELSSEEVIRLITYVFGAKDPRPFEVLKTARMAFDNWAARFENGYT